jgi:membrane associated rhomboid family serine protease
MDLWSDIKASFREGSIITRLIYINLTVFLVFRVTDVLFFLSGNSVQWIQWFELPADITRLLVQPWSLITYMFLHFDFLHILFNLLVLYWFGRLFLDYFSQNQLLGLYLIGGLAGGITYIVAYNIFPVFERARAGSLMLGASASIIAILIAAAIRDPNREILLFLIGRIPLKYLALFMIGSYIIGISTSNAGGNLAHLGGAASGWLFIAQYKRGRDLTAFVGKSFRWLSGIFKPRKKVHLVHKQPPRDDYEYNRQKVAQQEELNRILDKIGEEGYDSLTREEKETLFRQNH